MKRHNPSNQAAQSHEIVAPEPKACEHKAYEPLQLAAQRCDAGRVERERSQNERHPSQRSVEPALRTRKRVELVDFDIETERAALKHLQKMAPIDKQFCQLEKALFKFARRSPSSEDEAPAKIGEYIYPRLKQCHQDLATLAYSQFTASRAKSQTCKKDLAEWNAALRFIESYTAWLLPFRELIEDAQGRLLSPSPIVLETRTIEYPACEVVETAFRIAALASLSPNRAISQYIKPSLWQYFETLILIEQWHEENRVLDTASKP